MAEKTLEKNAHDQSGRQYRGTKKGQYWDTKTILIHPFIQVLACCVILISMGAADDQMGAEDMVLEGGSRGAVPFPHHRHHMVLGDCNICHSLFPQESGAVEDLKDTGGLKKKQVMNKLCIKCHRAERTAGRAHGPTTCAKCHVRGTK